MTMPALQKRILLSLTEEDTPYAAELNKLVRGFDVKAVKIQGDNGAEWAQFCKANKFTTLITTSQDTLNKLIDFPKPQRLSEWAGSYWMRNDLEILAINPLKQLYTVPYGKFLTARHLSKVLTPEKWPTMPEFTWETLKPNTMEYWYGKLQSAIMIGVDIESYSWEERDEMNRYKNKHTIIECICYSGLWIVDGKFQSHTLVMPINRAPADAMLWWVHWMRKYNLIPVPKVLQNGLYDSFHLMKYAAPMANYHFDTQSLFHSWYAEMPKRLDFVAAFTLKNITYWKDLATLGGDHNLFEYNAKDGWSTVCSCISMLMEIPDWARKNFLIKFPIWVPALACNLEGLIVDEVERDRLATFYEDRVKLREAKMERWFGLGFNSNSSLQVVRLMQLFGMPNADSSEDKHLAKWGEMSPINAIFRREIVDQRSDRKLLSTYLKPEHTRTKEQSPLVVDGRCFYALNPDGTDTARLSAKEGASWSGNQIQNQTDRIKSMYIPDQGRDGHVWLFGEADGAQAEARAVGYMSGDENLIATVESDKDYHKLNAERFFGVLYAEITKDIRDLAKRVNHGANYNMGANMLIDTMGERNILQAKRLLKIPEYFSMKMVAQFLLDCYSKTYPRVKGGWYDNIKQVVELTHMLVSPMGWTRFCFGHPKSHKLDLNAYVAHGPQNLSVMILNEGFKDVYWKIQYTNPLSFRLKAQIHDSIFFMFLASRLDLAWRVVDLATRDVPVRDYRNNVRNLRIPMDLKIGNRWSNMQKVERDTSLFPIQQFA